MTIGNYPRICQQNHVGIVILLIIWSYFVTELSTEKFFGPYQRALSQILEGGSWIEQFHQKG
jgi:hypothetical protein